MSFVKIFTVATGGSVLGRQLCGALARQDTLERFVKGREKANVQQSPVKTAVLALETTDVNAHLPTMALSATGGVGLEPKKTRRQTLKQSLRPEKVRAAACIGYSPQMKQPLQKRSAT